MAAKHGTRRRYNEGCRCDDCRSANAAYQREYEQRRAAGEPMHPGVVVSPPLVTEHPGPGPVGAGVQAEIADLQQTSAPGLVHMTLALAGLMDNQRAVNQHAAAANVLASLLDKLSSASAHGRRGHLALVRTLTEKGGA